MNIEEELLRKILEKLESIDENLESISNKLNKPLLIVMEKDWRKEVERVRQETKEWYRELNVATFPDIQLAARVLRNLKDYQEYLAACAG